MRKWFFKILIFLKSFRAKAAPEKKYLFYELPPMHPNCRCEVQPRPEINLSPRTMTQVMEDIRAEVHRQFPSAPAQVWRHRSYRLIPPENFNTERALKRPERLN